MARLSRACRVVLRMSRAFVSHVTFLTDVTVARRMGVMGGDRRVYTGGARAVDRLSFGSRRSHIGSGPNLDVFVRGERERERGMMSAPRNCR